MGHAIIRLYSWSYHVILAFSFIHKYDKNNKMIIGSISKAIKIISSINIIWVSGTLNITCVIKASKDSQSKCSLFYMRQKKLNGS